MTASLPPTTSADVPEWRRERKYSWLTLLSWVAIYLSIAYLMGKLFPFVFPLLQLIFPDLDKGNTANTVILSSSVPLTPAVLKGLKMSWRRLVMPSTIGRRIKFWGVLALTDSVLKQKYSNARGKKLTKLSDFRKRFEPPNRHANSLFFLFYDAMETYTFLWRHLVLETTGKVCPSTELLASFLRGYMFHEAAALASPEDQLHTTHRVATTFIGYSWIVQETVDSALRLLAQSDDVELRCATALAMAPERWYRFDKDAKRTAVWNPYRDFMRDTFGQRPGALAKAQILRLLVGLKETPEDAERWLDTQLGAAGGIDENGRSARRVILEELLRTTETTQQLEKLIFCPGSAGVPERVPASALREVYSLLATEERTAFETAYPSVRQVDEAEPEWLVLDKALGDAVVRTGKLRGLFIPLKRALKEEFHGGEHSDLLILTLEDTALSRFAAKDIPIDWFLIGEGRRMDIGSSREIWKSTQWHFCLAANYRKDLSQGLVEFMSPKVNAARFNKVVQFFGAVDRFVSSP